MKLAVTDTRDENHHQEAKRRRRHRNLIELNMTNQLRKKAKSSQQKHSEHETHLLERRCVLLMRRWSLKMMTAGTLKSVLLLECGANFSETADERGSMNQTEKRMWSNLTASLNQTQVSAAVAVLSNLGLMDLLTQNRDGAVRMKFL